MGRFDRLASDAIIENAGTLDELTEMVDEVWRWIAHLGPNSSPVETRAFARSADADQAGVCRSDPAEDAAQLVEIDAICLERWRVFGVEPAVDETDQRLGGEHQ